MEGEVRGRAGECQTNAVSGFRVSGSVLNSCSVVPVTLSARSAGLYLALDPAERSGTGVSPGVSPVCRLHDSHGRDARRDARATTLEAPRPPQFLLPQHAPGV